MMAKLLHRKRNMFYIICGVNQETKADQNPHTNPIFHLSPRLGDSKLAPITTLHLILPPL